MRAGVLAGSGGSVCFPDAYFDYFRSDGEDSTPSPSAAASAGRPPPPFVLRFVAETFAHPRHDQDNPGYWQILFSFYFYFSFFMFGIFYFFLKKKKQCHA